MAKRSWVRRVLGVGVLAGAAYAVWRAIEANRTEDGTSWQPQPFPFPPQPRTPEPAARPSAATPAPPLEPDPRAESRAESWVAATDGSCPASHPVKAARGSSVFHVPGGQLYDRTTAERCYRDPGAAEADGLRPSKR